MVYILLFLSIAFLIWLWLLTLQQRRDIESLRQQLKSLSAKVNAGTVPIQEKVYVQPEPVVQSPAMPQVTYQTPVPVKKQKAESDSKGSLERWFGRNVIGIMASVLVFIGLVFLGVLAYEHITETIKIVAMYALCTVLLLLGTWLTIKKRNNFTLILTGCGCGSYFIAILLTHIYFNRINDVAAFSLLLVWTVATLLLSKKVSSTLLSIVAHIGMAVSICFAFAQGVTNEKLPIVLIYQGVAIVIILLGNIFCCKKTYNFGIFISLLLTIIASSFMWDRLTTGSDAKPFVTALPVAVIAFMAQFICNSILSYLLSSSANKLTNTYSKVIVHFLNKFLWVASLVMNIYFVVYRISKATLKPIWTPSKQNLNAIMLAVFISIGVILVHSAITLLYSRRFKFDRKLETISVILLSWVMSVLLFVLWISNLVIDAEIFVPRISLFIVISLLLILADIISRNKAYSIASMVFLLIDALFMLVQGYKVLNSYGSILIPLGYMVLYILIISLQWYRYRLEYANIKSKIARLLSFFLTELSIISIIATSSINYKTEILLLTLALLNTVLYVIRFDREVSKEFTMKISFGINEFALLIVTSIFIAFDQKSATSTVLYLIVSALAFGLGFIRIRKVLNGSNWIESIWAGLKLTILVLAVIRGNTAWFDQTYIFSLVCMLTALTCIILGFIGKSKTLRYYGLSISLICVLKLVTFDVTSLNTLLRVLAFIGGGIICFVISAIYNYTSKKLIKKENAVI